MPKLLLAALALLFATPMVGAAAERPTRVVLYTMTDPITGTLRPGFTVVARTSGSCWTGSLSSARPDAWRCTADDEIRDPCFAAALDARIVYCPKRSDPRSLLAIALTKPLLLPYGNHGAASTSGTPTSLRLAGGVRCTFVTGAVGVVGGLRINYGCSDGRMLLGEVDRSSSRWRIYAMPRGGAGDVALVDIDTATF